MFKQFVKEQRIEMARRVAAAAACLDCLKSPDVSSTRALIEALHEAPDRVRELHDIAELLAGDHAHEIYAPEDNSHPVSAAGMTA
jgi:hypothetical protein